MVLVATQVKRRRGTTAENDAFTGAEGEIVVDTERHELRVHDGVTQGGFRIGGGSSLVIGQILEVIGTADYTPEGCLLADGAEYTKAQFPDLWADFLTGTPKLQTCTYTEYANQIAEYGFCNKFAVDTTNETFKVPTRNKYRKLVKKIVNGTSWANLYDDGWCEQGCNYINAGGTWNFPISMSNDTYTAVMSYRTSSSSNVPQWQYMWTGKYSDHILVAPNGLGQSIFVCGYAPIPNSTSNITREFVVVANGTLNQEQMDWSAWASSLAGRATTDMNNITSTGKETVVGWGIPDYSAGISLSGWGTATSNFNVPTDGVLQIIISSTSALEEFFVDEKIVCALANVSNYTGWAVNIFPISKGTHAWRTSSNPSRIYAVVFYPFKGVN